MPFEVQRSLTTRACFFLVQIDDQRFEVLSHEIPYASVALAIGLMIFGILCFVLAWMHFTQQILGKEQAVRMQWSLRCT
jgi:hypothetical protein